MGSDKAVFTQDPNGHVLIGEPIQPAAAYPSQTMPNPYYYQPPAAFYLPPPPPTAPVQNPYTVPPPVQAPAGTVPPPYYYGMPVGGVPEYPNKGFQAHEGYTCKPCGVEEAPVANAEYAPSQEVVANFSCGEAKKISQPTHDPSAVTHVNYHDNRLTSLEGLNAYPCLLRLTVSWNDLTSLRGIEGAQWLRWIDASGNYLKDFTGMGSLPALEWLNVTQSDIVSFKGLGFAPNLTWLCIHHNRFHDFSGIEAVPQLQFLDVSDNEVQNVTGLEKGYNLREINLCNNPLCEGNVRANVEAVKRLSALPNLFRLNINDTFYDNEEAEIVQHFSVSAPKVEVITTPERTAAVGHNYKFTGPKDVPPPKSSGKGAEKGGKAKKGGCRCLIA